TVYVGVSKGGLPAWDERTSKSMTCSWRRRCALPAREPSGRSWTSPFGIWSRKAASIGQCAGSGESSRGKATSTPGGQLARRAYDDRRLQHLGRLLQRNPESSRPAPRGCPTGGGRPGHCSDHHHGGSSGVPDRLRLSACSARLGLAAHHPTDRELPCASRSPVPF